ncbi:MAG: hypothetical protein H0U44_04525, partial [Flavisolibacter sp.]|nr:hypothetical protein [Flavisolibacter sp.]
MKHLILLLSVLGLFSCKKQIEKAQTDIVIEAMTSGQWKMVNYKDGAVDRTADFNSYSFQFKEDFTVDAIKNSAVEKTGTWSANAVSKTIAAQFNTAPDPLPMLNGTWNITKNSWT